jgi:moderate conductance mechanosensitive channel
VHLRDTPILGSFVLDPLVNFLNDSTPLYPPWGRIVVIVALFAGAWLVARLAALVAGRVLAWHDARHPETEDDLGAKIGNIKRRETSVGIVRTTIGYLAFTAALILSIAQMAGGVDRLATIAGGLFAVLVGVFVAQRVLTDLIAGLTMFVERWYSVGDTIVAVTNYELQGVVEDMSLRRTRMRSVTGEVINIHNSQIPAVRVLPGGVKEFDVELVASSREAAEVLVEHVGAILPEGPTTFIQRPTIHQVDDLAPGLVRLRMRAAVAPGREWLVNGFYTDLLKERAEKHLIVHGPVVLAADDKVERSFARASAATRWAGAR